MILPRGTGGAPVPLALDNVTVDVPRGSSIGGYGFGLLCRPPYNDIAWSQRPAWDGQLALAVRDGMAAGGAPLADDRRHGPLRSTQPWQLSARISQINFDLCRANDLWFGKPIGETGTATVTVEWTLQRAGAPPQRLTSHGRGGTDIPAAGDSKLLILTNALTDAALRLATHPDFRTVLSGPSAVEETAQATAQAQAIPGFPAPETTERETQTPADTTPIPAAIGDPLLMVSAAPRQRPALVLGPDGLALMPLEMEPDWLAAGAAPILPVRTVTDNAGGQAIPLAWDRLAAVVLLRVEMAPHPLPGMAPVRPRSPPVGSLLHPPGKPEHTAMIAARREEGPLPVLLLDLPEGLAPPPFLLDGSGRLAAVIAGQALQGDLQPYHPAGPLLTRLLLKLPTAGQLP
ncbi:hypothetical protein GE253_16955 [Niveispirillum sp. SYP-B3756]|uniref:hypothetical protein n=1 Tax=Niveispirillum sp. SYP-B3756 TaxID=2662178 RepID=UPI001291CA60|nr:hypothetical protein [Niveispirillum sp. SYP-B3756]MQP67019.1 hypothetical protein [Niveispirillum sp. SYP-B3756]